MLKKVLIKLPAYFALFAAVALTEKTLGLFGLGTALFLACLYCREKIYVTAPAYAGAELAVAFSLQTGIGVAAAVGVGIAVYFIHYKRHLNYRIFETELLTLACMAPTVAFSATDALGIAVTALAVALALIFHYLFLIGLYPVLVRGISYRFNGNEKFALGTATVLLCVGLGGFRPFGAEIFFAIAAAVLMLTRGLDRQAVVAVGVCMGLGAAIGLGSVAYLVYLAVIALICYATARLPSPLSAAAVTLSFLLTIFFFNGRLDLWKIIPLAVGCAAGMVVPKKTFKKILSSRQGYQERYALRTVVNRDRNALSEKLLGVAEAFGEMQGILIDERPTAEDPAGLVRAVCEASCLDCPRLTDCTSLIGSIPQAVSALVFSALDNGKATILDAGMKLSNHCIKLNHVIALTNEHVKSYRRRQERKSGIEQGKEMVVTNLGGTADLLRSLARSVNTGLSFDGDMEKKLIERLGQANIVATDVCFYADGTEREVAVIVREKDADKAGLAEIIGETLGCPMTEVSRVKEIAGMASLRYVRAPNYKVLYGESVSSKERRCGDTGQAIKIGHRKLMFILSDGMGTGKEAYTTANQVIKLIESFYKAGFDHKTVFGNVARLMSLRDKEDFSALDVAIIDVQTGDIDFIKQGGRESYVISGGECETIECGSLPLGIVADSEPAIEHRRLRPDDLVIMLSDGVADVINPEAMSVLIGKTPCQNPQNAADAIMTDAIRLSEHDDDMTVVALRLVRYTN